MSSEMTGTWDSKHKEEIQWDVAATVQQGEALRSKGARRKPAGTRSSSPQLLPGCHKVGSLALAQPLHMMLHFHWHKRGTSDYERRPPKSGATVNLSSFKLFFLGIYFVMVIKS